jgi:VIT1/CCC1 family predicted Fe2+/Mn2+ transporter
MVSFAVGAVIPLVPYLAGAERLVISVLVSAVALFVGGAMVGRVTRRPLVCSGLCQLGLGAAAAAVTYGIGQAIGGSTR